MDNRETLKALVELAKKATPGPWEVCRGFVRTVQGNPEVRPPVLKADGIKVTTSCLWVAECRNGEAFYNPDGNSDFIAAARNAIPALEALLQEPSVPVSELEAMIEEWLKLPYELGGGYRAACAESLRSLINRRHK